MSRRSRTYDPCLQVPVLVVLGFLLLAGCRSGRKVALSGIVQQRAAAARPVIIELVTTGPEPIDRARLDQVLEGRAANRDALYQWKNHYVVYDVIRDPSGLGRRIRQAFPGVEVRIYDQPFYSFDRDRCTDTGRVADWDHVLLTANLVADTVLQQEYLDHHAQQFEQWPEVAAGFCNARFQQLLLYRNGRQLMLVISIPRGTTLDELNPKTVENNPRVAEWNYLMQLYQEGLPGTAEGEVWVVLEWIKGKRN